LGVVKIISSQVTNKLGNKIFGRHGIKYHVVK
jgi:hypothetical protein